MCECSIYIRGIMLLSVYVCEGVGRWGGGGGRQGRRVEVGWGYDPACAVGWGGGGHMQKLYNGGRASEPPYKAFSKLWGGG